MEPAQFTFISELMKKRSGLVLTPDKAYLLESRLMPLARHYGCDSVPALIDLVASRGREDLIREITEAMTTNESSFFRDSKPFDYLRKELLPSLVADGKRSSLRIWSAACSTGQEAYSVGICLREEETHTAKLRCEIVATDLASKVVDKAKEAIYSQFEAQRGLPVQLLIKYFTQLPNTCWEVKPTLRDMVTFKLQNLLENYDTLGKFDLVFCRNVLIYFNEASRIGVIERIGRSLLPGGYLFVGSTEALPEKVRMFEPITACRGLYRLK
jgi:chemotaxis protein methyltransferase CheR